MGVTTRTAPRTAPGTPATEEAAPEQAPTPVQVAGAVPEALQQSPVVTELEIEEHSYVTILATISGNVLSGIDIDIRPDKKLYDMSDGRRDLAAWFSTQTDKPAAAKKLREKAQLLQKISEALYQEAFTLTQGF